MTTRGLPSWRWLATLPPPSRRGCPAGVEAPRLRPAALPQPGVPAAVRRDGARDVQGRGGPGPRRGRLPPGGRPAAGRAPSPPRPGCFACFRSWMLALSVSRREAGNAERPLWGPFSTAYYEVVQRSGGGGSTTHHTCHFFPCNFPKNCPLAGSLPNLASSRVAIPPYP